MPLPLLFAVALAAPGDTVLRNSAGSLLHWDSMPISYKADAENTAGLDQESALSAIVSASGAWTEVEGVAVDYRFRGTQTGLHGGYDEQNVVFFVDEWGGSSDLLALTSTWSTDDGTIKDFDMAVNVDHHDWSLAGEPGLDDLQNALTHEFGHALGLGHDELHHEATMYPTAGVGEVDKRDLSQYDVDVAAWLYPASEANPDSGGGAPSSGCDAVGLPSLGAVLPAALLLFRRRKEVP